MGERKGNFLENPFFSFFTGMGLTIIFYVILAILFKEGDYIFNFFSRGGPNQYIQGVNTWLFWTVVICLVQMLWALKKEGKAFYLEIPDRQIYPEEAITMAQKIPVSYRNSILGRRIVKLFSGHSRGEEIGVLNEELSSQDREKLEKDYSLIDGLKYLILFLGFGGTVLGFYTGMEDFPQISQSAKNIEALGASFSMAFGTTLLALGYSVILLLPCLILHHRQKALISGVDEKAQEIIKNLARKKITEKESPPLADHILDTFERKLNEISSHIFGVFQDELRNGLTEAVKSWLDNWRIELSRNSEEILQSLSNQNGKFGGDMVKAIQENGQLFVQKLDEMGKTLGNGKPHHYQIMVKPLDGGDINVQ